MLDDGLLDRHPLALCSTGTATDENGDENCDASTARWPPVECPRDFVTWRTRRAPKRPVVNGSDRMAPINGIITLITRGYFTAGRGPPCMINHAFFGFATKMEEQWLAL